MTPDQPPPRDETALAVAVRAGVGLLEALGVAVYTTDAEGRLTSYNTAAVALWGWRPPLGDARWCGSWRLFRSDGTPMPHETCPMARALRGALSPCTWTRVGTRQGRHETNLPRQAPPLHPRRGDACGRASV